MALVLASASPRRKELLAQLGMADEQFKFDILAADIDETHIDGETARMFVERLAIEKAQAGLALYAKPDAVVLGSDTIVVLDEQILGKPKDEADAKSMLEQLSGRQHSVMTAVAVTDGTQTLSTLVETKVQFCGLTEQDILAYIATGEPMDKAGGYGIQGLGGCFVQGIEGSYSAVVGLPLVETRALLIQMQAV
ncbi:Maf family nucleotide pyrophosphatase [Shewanella mesophila]|uniref:Maf family protein n=1 Tax=Shewanella mesophila TaxID=2864208 RepID=UPI001C65BA43|nr:Maf family protein [Shewanella mesophila]QYJ86514.1 Maf family nucleotide pyrophosphatase [Shewanella mesophila]